MYMYIYRIHVHLLPMGCVCRCVDMVLRREPLWDTVFNSRAMRDRIARSFRRAHNPQIGGLNPPPAMSAVAVRRVDTSTDCECLSALLDEWYLAPHHPLHPLPVTHHSHLSGLLARTSHRGLSSSCPKPVYHGYPRFKSGRPHLRPLPWRAK